MDILRDFEKPMPRKICRKIASREAGVGFNPWGFWQELGGCGGIVLGVLLLLAIIPAVRFTALVAAALFAVPVGIIALLSSMQAASEERHHKRLAQYGEAVVGQVTRLEFIHDNDDTPAPSTWEILYYRFHTRSGLELSGKRKTISGWYTALSREGVPTMTVEGIPYVVEATPVVVVYLPNDPNVNEPYNSLKYRVCD